MTKTALVTGAASGLGYELSILLAKDNYDLILVDIDETNLEKVKSALSDTYKCQITTLVKDLSKPNVANDILKEINFVPIDVLINNAGVFKTKDTFTKKGMDYRMVVNYLAPYVLTHAILPILKNAETPRIINLSSAAQSPVSEAVLFGKEQVSDNASYAQSKLALTMWSFHLAKQEPNITIIAVNPGSLLHTKMATEAYGQYWSPAEKGVDVLYDLALSEHYKNDTGKYFDNDKGHFSPAHADAYNQEKINNLLTLTDGLLV